MAGPTDLEQLLLELINDARLNPLADAARYVTSYTPLRSNDPGIQSAVDFFQVDGVALQTQYAALIPVKPLAWNEALSSAARAHSQAMIATDTQSHQLPGEASLGGRITSTGYVWSNLGENIFAFSESMPYAHAGFMIDWGNATPGHRDNIMNATFREVGLGVLQESNPTTSVGPYVVTQDFGRSSTSSAPIVLGVVYGDSDKNNFYSPGEGKSNVTVSVDASSTATTSSGGYAIAAAAGPHTITLSGGTLSVPVVLQAQLATGENYKIDLVDGATLATSVSVTVLSGASKVVGLGVAGLTLHGAQNNETFVGTRGNDTIDGGSGVDTVVIGVTRSNVALATAGDTRTVSEGNIGVDTLVNVERLAFTDGNVAFDIGANQNAGEAYRVYQAAFNRTPDTPGLGFWIKELDAGKGDLAWVANNFIISNEFKATYGSPASVSDTQFITLLYNNVLHRNPDPAGLAFWQNEISHGFERSRILASFSESTENQANVIGVIHDGIFYT